VGEEVGSGSPTRAQALQQLRERLERAGFDQGGVDRLVRDSGSFGFDEGLAALRLRPGADEPLAVLVRLFLSRESLPTATVAGALAPVDVHELARAGLVTVSDGLVRTRVALQPFEGFIIASDRLASRMRPDHVLNVGPSTRIVAALTVRRPAEAALDFGTGSGVQAFLAARHCERVVGLDLNRRALRLARLNAELNGIENVEWREGNLFEPAGDERFGLVVANPPFIISPVSELTYRDGGLGGDLFSREVVTGAVRHLEEGGFATIVCSWVTEPGGDCMETPRSWLEGSGCDVWVLELVTDDPVRYAMRWNGFPGRRPAAVAAMAEPWLADYRARGIEAIASGAIILRRRSGPNWERFDHLASEARGDAGAHLERVFAAQDLLRSLRDDRELLTMPLSPAPGTLLVERRLPGGELERGRLTVEQGLPLNGRVPLAVAPVLAGLDGKRPLAEVVEAVARSAGVSTEALSGESVPALRELVARGLLVVR
jgi:methylase of polypeptide subunit release factors